MSVLLAVTNLRVKRVKTSFSSLDFCKGLWLLPSHHHYTMSKKARQVKKSQTALTDTCSFHDFTQSEIEDLRKSLLSWYDSDHRKMPWREVKSADKNIKAYSVWVSEVMLQQTQVATVIDYYNRWMQKWPTVQDLALATVEEVNTMWSGLGYYSRGRSLLDGAKKVVNEMGGELPQTADDLQRLLPGVGRYTAGAIASIAFGQVTGLVDGNVMRVLSRLRLIGAFITDKTVVEKFWSHAHTAVDPQRPGDFNQSVMELGATVCTPKTPTCSSCPVRHLCHAYTKVGHEGGKLKSTGLKSFTKLKPKVEIPDIENTVPDCQLCLPVGQEWDGRLGVVNLPRKPPKVKAKEESLYTLIIRQRDEGQDTENGGARYWMVRRPEKGLLAGLWEFPVRPRSESQEVKKLNRVVVEEFGMDEAVHDGKVTGCGQVTHLFSHIHHTYHILSVDVDGGTDGWVEGLNPDGRDSRWITVDQMEDAAISTGMKKVFKQFQDHLHPKPAAKTSTRKRPREEEVKGQRSQPSISSFFQRSAKGKQ